MTDLVKRLWESDEASVLTNEAARHIEWMRRVVRYSRDYKVVECGGDGCPGCIGCAWLGDDTPCETAK